MRLKRTYFLSGIVAFTFSCLMIGGAFAHHLGQAQYWTDRVGPETGSGRGGRQVKLSNRGPTPMFVLLIEYEEDLSFDDCDAAIAPALGRVSGNQLSKLDGRSYNEVIAVPTVGRFAGRITNHALGVQVWRGTDPRPWTPADAAGFVLRSGVESCACGKLSDFGFPKTLLNAFGISC